MYRLAERTTGQFADVLIEQSGLPSSSLEKLTVLDNACGTGVVTAKLLDGSLLSEDTRAKVDLTSADFADAMLAAIKDMTQSKGWPVTVVKADAMDTKLASSHYTHILFSFGPMLMRDPMASIRECMRMLQPGGILGINTWMRVPWIEEYRPVFERHPELPPYPKTDEEVFALFSESPGIWHNVDEVKDHLESVGFQDVAVNAVTRTTTYSLEDVIAMLPATLGMLTTKLWQEEERQSMQASALKAVEGYLREKHTDGNVTWTWVAAVATGRKPE